MTMTSFHNHMLLQSQHLMSEAENTTTTGGGKSALFCLMVLVVRHEDGDKESIASPDKTISLDAVTHLTMRPHGIHSRFWSLF